MNNNNQIAGKPWKAPEVQEIDMQETKGGSTEAEESASEFAA